ncbi:dipeptidase [Dactylosporangium sp. CA-233914]|uniref:dipeptidase n=1 Tax=Dactylosporangium sp. CA-233914 TaxID=3239934 RepID=UPI003D94ED28
MINSYVGPAVGNVIALHGSQGHQAQVLRTHHLPRWRAGGLTGAVMQVGDWATLAVLVSEVAQSEGELVFVRTRAEFDNRPAGSFGLFISVEGYLSFAGDFDALHALSELGITAFTFSHNVQNVLCTGANERFGEGGLTHLGKATLAELERLPVMVDLVHMSRASFWDALELYSGDVFVSHSDADAVNPHPRNLTDDQIKAVAERNGVVGLNSYRGYVHQDPFKATLSDLLDHAMHVYDLVGPEHMALGLDFWEGPMEQLAAVMDAVDPDGSHGLHGTGTSVYSQGPAGLEDISHLGNFAAGLVERGLSQAEVDLVTGGSYLRMLERARP